MRDATRFFVRVRGERVGNFHCFSCKKSGSLAALVMHVRGLADDERGFAEAKAFIETAAKGHRPPEGRARVVARPPTIARHGFELPPGILFDPLPEWDTLPRRYAEGRGLTAEDVARWGIGYAVDGWLSCRVVFPFRDALGRVTNYSGRTFVDEDPRFRTPREGEGQDEDAILGEHLWPPLGQRKIVAVIEGPVDTLTVARECGLHVAGLGGSDVRPGHVVALATFDLVLVMTDADEPGDHAARIIRSSLGRHVETRRCRLPEGTDAALLAAGDAGKKIKPRPELLRSLVERALARSNNKEEERRQW